MRSAIVLFACVLVAGAMSAWIQNYAPGCESERSKMAALVGQQKGAAPLDQFRAYLGFLEAAPEEPADCVHRDMRERIGDVEMSLVKLVVDGRPVQPWKVFHCDALNSKTKACEGPQADDSGLIPEDKLLVPKASLGASASVTVLVDGGYRAKILEALGGSRKLMQDGQVPFRLVMKGDVIRVGELKKYLDPVVMVVLERKDLLKVRKFVWYLGN